MAESVVEKCAEYERTQTTKRLWIFVLAGACVCINVARCCTVVVVLVVLYSYGHAYIANWRVHTHKLIERSFEYTFQLAYLLFLFSATFQLWKIHQRQQFSLRFSRGAQKILAAVIFCGYKWFVRRPRSRRYFKYTKITWLCPLFVRHCISEQLYRVWKSFALLKVVSITWFLILIRFMYS